MSAYPGGVCVVEGGGHFDEFAGFFFCFNFFFYILNLTISLTRKVLPIVHYYSCDITYCL